MPSSTIIDHTTIDFDNIVADIEEIRTHNRQRFEMEQLTAVVFEDTENHIAVGYKDITEEDFWVKGHMPGSPLMPGVIMLEAAAQLTSFYTTKHDLSGDGILGFGGVDGVRFRGVVQPGDRFIVVAKAVKIRRNRMLISNFECFVEDKLICSGTIRGVVINLDEG